MRVFDFSISFVYPWDSDIKLLNTGFFRDLKVHFQHQRILYGLKYLKIFSLHIIFVLHIFFHLKEESYEMDIIYISEKKNYIIKTQLRI